MAVRSTHPVVPTSTPVSCAARARSAFSLIEMMMVLALVGIVVMIALPSSTEAIARSRVNRASNVVMGDLELAFSLSARQHRPLRIVSGGTSYAIVGRANDTLQVRWLGDGSDFGMQTVTFTPTSAVDVFPTGLASGSLTITIARDGFTRSVTMTRAGQVRSGP
ncbi:MAG: type II secretion system protein [Gemmatimonadaceae bacterium]